MKILSLFFMSLLGSVLVSSVSSREVCHGDLGCFTDASPFGSTIHRPIPVLPGSPQKIATRLMLYKRDITANGVSVSYDNRAKEFDPSLKTVMIIHGFFSTSVPNWALEIKNSILKVENVNVITVDWTKGNQFPYIQAVANTQVLF